MTKIIEVTVSPQGEVTVQTHGFNGSNCQQASRALETALGLRSTEQLTSEFFATEAAEARQQI